MAVPGGAPKIGGVGVEISGGGKSPKRTAVVSWGVSTGQIWSKIGLWRNLTQKGAGTSTLSFFPRR